MATDLATSARMDGTEEEDEEEKEDEEEEEEDEEDEEEEEEEKVEYEGDMSDCMIALSSMPAERRNGTFTLPLLL